MTQEIALPQEKTIGAKNIQARNYWHLYWDVFWYGLTFGSTLSFLSVFATRLGATGWQVGLLTAGPALVNVLLTVTASKWVDTRPLGRTVTQTAIWQRLGLVALAPLPFLFSDPVKIWVALILILITAVPGTGLAIAFNAFLATTVPGQDRGHVVGIRNALLAATITASFWGSGWILDQLSFEWGYAVVFGLGAIGLVMSTVHLAQVKVPEVRNFPPPPAGKPQAGLEIFARIGGAYRWAMLAYFLFHFGLLITSPLMPLFWVNEIHLTDGQIGVVNAVYYLSMLVTSFTLSPLTRRFGNHHLTVWGTMVQILYPALTGCSNGLPLLIAANIIGGASWGVLGGTYLNRLLEIVPEDSRPTYLALYNMALNLATFSSTLIGPLMADFTGLREALFIAGVIRLLSGLALARWT